MRENSQPSENLYGTEPTLIENAGDILQQAVVEDQYLNGPDELLARWAVYSLAEHPVDFDKSIISDLELRPSDTVVDIGCGTGRALHNLRANNHIGPLIGFDVSERMIRYAKKTAEESDLPPIYFLKTDAQRLPVADNSADASLALFMLYHVLDPAYALSELKRATKPGGKIAIATSGDNNKERHRQFEKNIARHLKIAPPPAFTPSFDFDVAETTLPLLFEVIKTFPHIDKMRVYRKDYPVYINSLLSMRKSFFPVVSRQRWEEAVEAVVKPAVVNEINLRGYFTDYIERYYFICENNKKSNSSDGQDNVF